MYEVVVIDTNVKTSLQNWALGGKIWRGVARITGKTFLFDACHTRGRYD